MLVADFQSGPAWINLGGKDTKVSFAKEVSPKKLVLNSRITRTYETEGCTVTARYRVSEVCQPNTECDGYGVSGRVSVSTAGRERSVAVQGVCGC